MTRSAAAHSHPTLWKPKANPMPAVNAATTPTSRLSASHQPRTRPTCGPVWYESFPDDDGDDERDEATA